MIATFWETCQSTDKPHFLLSINSSIYTRNFELFVFVNSLFYFLLFEGEFISGPSRLFPDAPWENSPKMADPALPGMGSNPGGSGQG